MLSEEQSDMVEIMMRGASLFERFHLSREGHSQQFQSNHAALLNFLSSYAFERAGPVAVYKSIGMKAVKQVIPSEFEAVEPSWDERVWKKCGEIWKESYSHVESLNERLFPLNATKGKSRNRSLLTLMASGAIGPNIAIWCRDMLASGNTSDTFHTLRKIHGVSDKITSLYMRDIAHLSLDENSRERIADPHLLQPIDVWVKRVLRILTGEDLSIGKARKRIIKLSPSVSSSLRFNMGAWILGSEVAGDEATLERILHGDYSSIVRKAEEMEQRATAYRGLIE